MDTWIRGFYLLAVIFGVGVTLVDLLGLLGNDSEGDADDVGGSAEALAHDASQSEGDAPDNVNVENGLATQSHVGDASSLLIVLKYLRMAVYFSLGFGPTGLVALNTNSSTLASLVWSVPCGMVALFVSRAFFRFQQRDVDSTVKDKELFFAKAQVIVTIPSNGMGKVRVVLGQSSIDRYARSEKPDMELKKGEEIYIVRTTGECVYVERSSTDAQSADDA